ncbi:MAG: DUF368 domain-containing protein [Phycisphaerae bacterium]
MKNRAAAASRPNTTAGDTAPRVPIPRMRTAVAGVLMGLANLVPGVSGGTMILVMGLYDDFITSLADVVRLRPTRRSVGFLMIVVGFAGAAIALGSGPMRAAVRDHHSAMYALFIGMTLGGAPLLYGMLQPVRRSTCIGVVVGLAIMIGIAASRPREPEHRADTAAAPTARSMDIAPDYGRDAAAGALGMSAMVLPGISGAYMLLVLDRYEPVLGAVAMTKTYVASMGADGAPDVFLRVMIPVAVGAILSIILLSRGLKWLLHHHERPTVAVLLGILLGSVIGIWPFDAASGPADYTIGVALAALGFGGTCVVSRIKA